MIKSFLDKLKQLFSHSYLIILGFILFNIYIWFRFIRTRLPQDIPFNLSVLKLFTLLFLCFLYLYLIFRIYKKPQPHPLLLYLIPYLLWISNSLVAFDKYIKSLPFIKENFHKCIIYLAHKLDYSNLSRLEHLLFIWFNNLPRLILLAVFFMDVFYFHKLFYIYYFLPLSLLLWLPKYILYSFKAIKEDLILALEKEIEMISTPVIGGITPFDTSVLEDDEDEAGYVPYVICMSVRKFIEYYIEGITIHDMKFEYLIYTQYYLAENLCKKYNYENTLKIPRDLREELIYKPIKYKLLGAIYTELIVWLDDIIMTSSVELKPQEHITCMIYLVYFICWAYILMVSFPTLPGFSGTIEFLNLFLQHFSNFMQP